MTARPDPKILPLWQKVLLAPLVPFVWLVSFPLMLLAFTLGMVLIALVGHDRGVRWGFMAFMGYCIRTTLSRLTITFDRRYDKHQTVVYAMAHTSLMDGHLACNVIPDAICGLENEAHLHVPFYGWVMRGAKAIAVTKAREGRLERLLEDAKDRAARSISILTFPEGHRTPDGTVQPLRRGAFFMARAAGIPVVPICVRGWYEVFPKGRVIIKPGHIRVYFGPPLRAEGLSDDEIGQLADYVHGVMTGWLERGEMVDEVPELFRLEAVPNRAAE